MDWVVRGGSSGESSVVVLLAQGRFADSDGEAKKCRAWPFWE